MIVVLYMDCPGIRCFSSPGTFAGEAWRQQRCRSGWRSASKVDGRIVDCWLGSIGVWGESLGFGLAAWIEDFGLLFGVLSPQS